MPDETITPPGEGVATPPTTVPPPEPSPTPSPIPTNIDDMLGKELDARDKEPTEKPPVEPPKEEPPKPPVEVPPKVEAPLKAPEASVLEKLTPILEKLAEGQKPPEVAKAPPTEPPIKLWEASDADVDAIIEGGEKGRNALTQMVTKATAQAVQLSLMVQQNALQPLQQFVQQAQARQQEEAYITKYPDHKSLLPLAREIGMKLWTAKGDKYKSWDEFYGEIHAETEKLATEYRKIFGAVAAPPGNGEPPPPTPPPRGGARTPPAPKLSEDQQLMKELQEEDARYRGK